jgi:hypothetical protein
LASFGAPCVALPEPDRAGRHGLLAEHGDQVGELAGFFPQRQPPAPGDHRDAGGVVAAVLQAAQSLDDHVQRLARTCVPHDAAHGIAG